MSSSESLSAVNPAPTSPRSTALQTRCVLAAVHSSPAQNHDVLRVATRLAKAANAPLTVLSVLEATARLPNEIATHLSDAVAQMDADYAQGGARQQQCHVYVTAGDPDYEISTFVLAMNAAMLVIGRGEIHGHGKVLSALLNGIRSARVSRGVPVPVVSVAPTAAGHDPLETIVVATDLSPASWVAAVTAVEAAPPGAHVHVVYVAADEVMPDPRRLETLQGTLTTWSAPLIERLPARATLLVTVLQGDAYPTLETYLSMVGATCVAIGGHRPRFNTISVVGYTVPERLLATWSGSMIFGPYHDPASE